MSSVVERQSYRSFAISQKIKRTLAITVNVYRYCISVSALVYRLQHVYDVRQANIELCSLWICDSLGWDVEIMGVQGECPAEKCNRDLSIMYIADDYGLGLEP